MLSFYIRKKEKKTENVEKLKIHLILEEQCYQKTYFFNFCHLRLKENKTLKAENKFSSNIGKCIIWTESLLGSQ